MSRLVDNGRLGTMYRAIYAKAVCCREWPIVIAFDGRFYGPLSVRSCGRCGAIPVLTDEEWEYVDPTQPPDRSAPMTKTIGAVTRPG